MRLDQQLRQLEQQVEADKHQLRLDFDELRLNVHQRLASGGALWTAFGTGFLAGLLRRKRVIVNVSAEEKAPAPRSKLAPLVRQLLVPTVFAYVRTLLAQYTGQASAESQL